MQTKSDSNSQETKGAFVRKQSAFRNFISEDSDRFKPESGRYHLYISYGCPWANRTAIVRNLKGLQDHIGLSVTHPTAQKTKPGVDDHLGWVFVNEGDQPLANANGFGSFTVEGCIPDTVNNCRTIRDLYELSNDTTGPFSVPVLWDKKEKVIVNNESSEIIRILNSAFNKFSTNPGLDLYPESLRAKIDEVNDWVYNNINNGVYRAGFATSQEAYDPAVKNLFDHLDKAEEVLSKSRYLCGDKLTEADIRLFVTLVRFDEAYAVHFKCNKKMIKDYPNLLNYTREIYQIPAVRDAVKMDHIKLIYYSGKPIMNPYAIIPIGPNFIGTLQEKHDRDRF